MYRPSIRRSLGRKIRNESVRLSFLSRFVSLSLPDFQSVEFHSYWAKWLIIITSLVDKFVRVIIVVFNLVLIFNFQFLIFNFNFSWRTNVYFTKVTLN